MPPDGKSLFYARLTAEPEATLLFVSQATFGLPLNDVVEFMLTMLASPQSGDHYRK